MTDGGADTSSDGAIETPYGSDERSDGETARSDGVMELPAIRVVLGDGADERSGSAKQPADEVTVPSDERVESTVGLL